MLNRLHNLWVVCHAILATGKISLEVLFRLPFGPPTPDEIDQKLRSWSKSLLKAIGLEARLINPEAFQLEAGKRYIIMCNHASLYDIPVTFNLLPGHIRMLAKKELFGVPIWGRAMQHSGFLSIDRENKKQALADLELAKERMKQGTILWVAPEGTRSRTGELQPFKKGVFRLAMDMEAIIIPFAIKGMYELMPPETMQVKRNHVVEARVGRMIDCTSFKRSQRKEVIAQVEEQLLSLANLTKAPALEAPSAEEDN